MFREMRKKERQLTDEVTKEILKSNDYGVLSTIGEDSFPYGVPISYAYRDDVIYLHGALTGHKIDNMMFNSNVCFTVVDNSSVETLPSKFSTRYKSAIVFGRISIVEDAAEKQKGLESLIEKYSSDFYESGLKYIDSASKTTNLFKIEIMRMTGKGRL